MARRKGAKPPRSTPAVAEFIHIDRNKDGTYAVVLSFLGEQHEPRGWESLPRKYLLQVVRDYTDPALVLSR